MHTTLTQTQKKLPKIGVFGSPHTFDDHNTMITCFFKKQTTQFENLLLDALLMWLLLDDISSNYKGYPGGQLAGYLELVSQTSSYTNDIFWIKRAGDNTVTILSLFDCLQQAVHQ